MRMRLLAGLLLSTLLLSPVKAAPQAGTSGPRPAPGASARERRNDEPKPTLWIIPHTHWEGAVFKTREEYLQLGLPHILTALNLLKIHPDYRFVLDQVSYVKPFLERYPEEAAAFRKFVSEGRLELVGANDVMLDVNIPGGESWVRQAVYGKRYYRDKLGVDVKVGWALDTFGHHAQMPQLLKLAGYKSYWFQRGVRGVDVPSEFLWQGIDGTRVPAFWLPQSYVLFYPSPKNLLEFDRYTRNIWNELGRFSQWPDRVALAGADVAEPEEILPAMVEEFNRKDNPGISCALVCLRISKPSLTSGPVGPSLRGN